MGYSGEVRRERPETGAPGGGLQWYGVLIPPLAMLTNLSLGFALVPWSCSANNRALLHVEIALLVLISVSGGLVAHREWRRHGGGGEVDDAGGPAARSRFLGVLGMASSALFTLILLGQWLANAFLTPCNLS
ncbi:MAG TPA: hypothetical protein VHM30_08750 [Gemmatimonadaceae bacterium]|nr:hypothetical protein [Gemmatimonadaceae bacterium]